MCVCVHTWEREDRYSTYFLVFPVGVAVFLVFLGAGGPCCSVDINNKVKEKGSGENGEEMSRE